MEIYPDAQVLRNRKEQETNIPIENELKKRKEFSDREVGLTHPDLTSFIRLNDQGDIEIFASPGIGIVISTRSKSISLFADSIRMFCKDDGLRWNNYNFNYSASKYIEPTLVKINTKSIHSAQNGISYYLDRIPDMEEEENQKTVTIQGDYGFNFQTSSSDQKYTTEIDLSDLTIEQAGLVQAYSSKYSSSTISLLIKYIREGLNFDQALDKAIRENNEWFILNSRRWFTNRWQ